jgi:lipoyl(octanoyl) transferase
MQPLTPEELAAYFARPTLLSLPNLQCRWMGRMDYQDGLRLQDSLVKQLASPQPPPEQILLLEHDPVYTIGRLPDKSSLRDPSQLPHPLVEISRGGQATYHGPGQMVGYPILDLRHHLQDLHKYLRCLEEIIIQVAAVYGVKAGRREAFTGVWVENRKLASIGVGVRQWITLHGFALNVLGPLDGFHAITPCGIDNVAMTSLEAEGAAVASVEACAQVTAECAAELLASFVG